MAFSSVSKNVSSSLISAIVSAATVSTLRGFVFSSLGFEAGDCLHAPKKNSGNIAKQVNFK